MLDPEEKRFYDAMASTGGSLAKLKDYDDYIVCASGLILDSKRKRVVETFIQEGIVMIRLYQGAVSETLPLALCVLESFGRPYVEGYGLRFRDGNSQNCSIDNLFWLKRD